MAPFTPYTYIQCPCSDLSTLSRTSTSSAATTAAGPVGAAASAAAGAADFPAGELDDDERTFDPRAPRSNYSLYPLEYLLYCEDCAQIRCPRCVADEVVTYYCPSCLFEVPSSNLKSEGNRCTRSCFQCPICIGPLGMASADAPPDTGLLAVPEGGAAATAPAGPYILACSHCGWSSAEIGIKFDKANGVYAQLARLRNGGAPRLTAKERKERRKEAATTTVQRSAKSGGGDGGDDDDDNGGDENSANKSDDMHEKPPEKLTTREEPLDIEAHFAALKSFYQNQLAESSGAGAASFSSLGELGFASPTSLSRIMSLYTGGGLHGDKKLKPGAAIMREAADSDEGLQLADLDESAGIAQLRATGLDSTASADQLEQQAAAHLGEPGLYGRGRFCSELRPIPYLLRTKRSKRCPVCRHIISKPEAKVQTTRFRIRLVAGSYVPSISIRPLMAGAGPAEALRPLAPVQYLLTFRNPIFETVKVTLAAPATTQDRFASKVTVLCPEFEIDANTDVWEEALKDDGRDRRRKGSDGQLLQAEAGKVYERGRNWVSIVVEVVPASLRPDLLPSQVADRGPLREDEDILEIPMFVRVEWEAEAGGDEVGSAPSREKEAKEKRELAYWCVLGIGRVSQN